MNLLSKVLLTMSGILALGIAGLIVANKFTGEPPAGLQIGKPYAIQTTLKFTGEPLDLSVENFNSKYIIQSGEISATDPGEYVAVFSLNPDKNTRWKEDNTVDPVNIKWQIEAPPVPKPIALLTRFSYDATEKNLNVRNFNETYMTESGNTSATLPGVYVATYTLISNAMKWADGSNAPVNIVWRIDNGNSSSDNSSGGMTMHEFLVANGKNDPIVEVDNTPTTPQANIVERPNEVVPQTPTAQPTVENNVTQQQSPVVVEPNTSDPRWVRSNDKRGVYFVNNVPIDGASATYYGNCRKVGDHYYADGKGKIIWYKGNMLITRIDEGFFKKGEPDGQISHRVYSNG